MIFTWPPPLAAGARVSLIAPAGPLRGQSDIDSALSNCHRLGWEPVVASNVLSRTGYLAGHDAQRLADLDSALRDAKIDAVWCLRGGYGSMRILPRVDYNALSRNPKAIIGFSDVTALHAAIGRSCRIVTFHASVARGALSPFAEHSLRAAVSAQENGCGYAPRARVLRAGQAVGRLAGGNLAVLAALAGTPFFPDLDGTILVLEDIHEAVYRVDRMMHQLLLGDMLGGVRAIAGGHFTDVPDDPDGSQRTCDDVIAEIADRLRIPALAGVPVGHVDEQWTIPLGARATIDAGAQRLDVHPPGDR